MRLISLGIASVVFGWAALYADAPSPHISSANPRTPEEEQKSFHLPPGFAIELVAAEPDVRKPINLNFDARGRLWVTQSTEYPFPVGKERKPKDCVKVIEWAKPHGKADKVSTFADDLNIPIGVLPLTQGAIVHSIPDIWRLEDPQNTGHAASRKVLYGTYGYRDTHGMTGSFNWGFDGWIYACHGFSNTSTIKAADGSALTMTSGNTYRFKADGSRVEQFTWGQVNPFGLSFDPLGNLFSADCHTKPAMQLLRGGHYNSFGIPDDGLGFAPEMMTHDHGSTAICGIVYYAADQFPPEFRDTLYIGNVVTNRINHDRLERHGSTYRAILQPDFLKSDDPWFRPVDIKLGPDGCLYVADFYNRIIGHYEVPLNHPGRDKERGRIWRIVYRGTDGKAKPPAQPRPDWIKASVPELVADLGHPNLAVRITAANQLAERDGEEAAQAARNAMKPESNAFQRCHGLWVLERLGKLSDDTLTAAVGDIDTGVRVHAMRVLSERKELPPALRSLVVARLNDPDAFVQRAAVDALGRHPLPENIRPLLALRQVVPKDDTHLLHAVRMALRDQFRPAENWKKLPSPWSDADARLVADVAVGVPSAEAGVFLVQHIQRVKEPAENIQRYAKHAARFCPAEQVPVLWSFAAKNRPGDLRQQADFFQAMQQGTQSRGSALPAEGQQWAGELIGQLLNAKDNGLQTRGIGLAGALKLSAARATLEQMVGRKQAPETQRRDAANALVAIDAKGSVGLLGRILADATEPPGLREQVAGMLAGINQPESRAELVKVLPTAPGRLQSAIAAGLAGSGAGAEQLLEIVAAGKASARLLLERPVELKLSQTKLPNLKERLAKLTAGLPRVDQRVEELLRRRRAGFASAKADPALGAKVFEKNCAVCHQLANKGAKVGPQLDGIGIRGLDRLLEDIIDPNRNVDQAFRATTLALKDGKVVMGLVLREEGQVLVVADAQGKEVRVGKDAIDERAVSQLSPMPANLAEQIVEGDFYHLLAYLLAQRPGKD